MVMADQERAKLFPRLLPGCDLIIPRLWLLLLVGLNH